MDAAKYPDAGEQCSGNSGEDAGNRPKVKNGYGNDKCREGMPAGKGFALAFARYDRVFAEDFVRAWGVEIIAKDADKNK